MIVTIIKIRYKQLSRGLIGIGLIRIIFLICLIALILGFLFIKTSGYPNSLYISGISGFVLSIVQTKREDKLFLKTNLDNYRLIYLVEYLLLVSPIIVFLTIHLQWIPLLLLLAAITIIIHLDLKTSHRSLNTKIQQLIPSECFEWKSGVRRTLVFIVPLWIISLGTSFLIWSVPIVFFILGIILFSFYEKCEPYQMILVSEMRPTQFIFHKIKLHVSLFSVLIIPLIAAFLIFHHELWYIPIAEYFIFVSLYVYMILVKYVFYEPNIKSPAAQSFIAIGALCGIIPIFLPVVWLLSIRFYIKSRENLSLYLNDYN